MRLLLSSVGLLGLLAVFLSLYISRLRRTKHISLGDGGDPTLLAAMRAHGNFMEFVPLCLLLIFLVMDYYGGRMAGILAAILLLSRLLHAGGMLDYIPRGRFLGAVGTYGVLIVAAVEILLLGFRLKPF
ncbi:MAG TPA: MAPEG family protein [Reyranella sp.]|jgi:uncharacterized membrane protein YecN with MAPEG domain|nr:MAPEG family protein [Reyranella sp.]